MPTDPAWLTADSYKLMERTQALSGAGRAQIAEPRASIAESRRIVGYMNAHQQRVIARAQTRSDQSPLLVMRCGVCGHHYGSEEDRVVSQRCPRHDAGRTGPSAEAGDVEWLEPATVGRRLSTAVGFM